MNLSQNTQLVLSKVRSIHRPKMGFYTEEHIRSFWKKFGAQGFLNIKEVSPKMVREIRENIIEKSQGGRA